MVPEQKRAWFVLAVFAAMIVAVLALIPVLGVHAWAGFSVFGFAGLTPVLFRKKRDAGEVQMDERDRMIGQRASFAGAMMSYMVFFLACMGGWFALKAQGRETVPIEYLPFTVFCGGVAFAAAQAAATVILYGRGARDGED